MTYDYELPQDQPRATVSPRELRTLARRLTKSARHELAAAGRAIDKMLAGEIVTRPHHANDDYDPARCVQCLRDVWTAYAIGVAFPEADAEDLDRRFAGLWGLTGENLELAIDNGRNENTDPGIRHAQLKLGDANREEFERVRAELQPGCWYRSFGRWVRDPDVPDPPPDPDVDKLLSDIQATNRGEMDRFIRSTPGVRFMQRDRVYAIGTDRDLVHEIRFGSDPRTARAAKRTALRKEMDVSWLL